MAEPTETCERILVTGANGFVGRELCSRLESAGKTVRRAVRAREKLSTESDGVVVGDLAQGADWSDALSGIDAVVHLAARAHVLKDEAADPLASYRAVNVEGTRKLATHCATVGVRRLVFVSSIGVNGDLTRGEGFREVDPPNPRSAYAASKWEAEQALWEIAGATGLEVVVVRAPLVYGPGAPGNFASLLRWVDRGVPLPLASIANHRSLVGVGNLAELLALCVVHPGAAGETFLVCDGADLSTPGLIREIAERLSRRARLFPFPVPLLVAAARLAGKGALTDRLCGSLQIDQSKAMGLLGWQPPASVAEELDRAVGWYQEHRASRRSLEHFGGGER